jgi:hypothetical protein
MPSTKGGTHPISADRHAPAPGRRDHRQIVEATDWRPHTVRGFFAGALKRKLGLEVTSEKVDGVRVYHLA